MSQIRLERAHLYMILSPPMGRPYTWPQGRIIYNSPRRILTKRATLWFTSLKLGRKLWPHTSRAKGSHFNASLADPGFLADHATFRQLIELLVAQGPLKFLDLRSFTPLQSTDHP